MPFVFTTFGLTCLANGLNSFRKVAQVFPIRDRQHAQGAARSDELLNGFHALGNRHVARLDEPNAVVDALLALQYALGRGRCEFRLLSPLSTGGTVAVTLLGKRLNSTNDKRRCTHAG